MFEKMERRRIINDCLIISIDDARPRKLTKITLYYLCTLSVFGMFLSACALPEYDRIKKTTDVAELVNVNDDYLCLPSFDRTASVIAERKRRGLGNCTEYLLYVEEYRIQHGVGGGGGPGAAVLLIPALLVSFHDLNEHFQTVSSPSCPWSLAAAREGRLGCNKGKR